MLANAAFKVWAIWNGSSYNQNLESGHTYLFDCHTGDYIVLNIGVFIILKAQNEPSAYKVALVLLFAIHHLRVTRGKTVEAIEVRWPS